MKSLYIILLLFTLANTVYSQQISVKTARSQKVKSGKVLSPDVVYKTPALGKSGAISRPDFSIQPVSLTLMQATKTENVSVARPVLAGIAGGAAGLLVGGLVGYWVTSDADYRGDGPPPKVVGAWLGSIIGEAIILPVGVHIGNKRRGNLALDMLTSVTVVGGGLLLKKGKPRHIWIILALQILGTVAVERVTADDDELLPEANRLAAPTFALQLSL